MVIITFPKSKNIALLHESGATLNKMPKKKKT